MIKENQPGSKNLNTKNRLKLFLKAAQKPFFLIVLSLILGGYLSFFSHHHETIIHSSVSAWLSKIAAVLLFFSLFWLAMRLINTMIQELQRWSENHGKQVIVLICPLISTALKIIAGWVLFNISLPFLFIPMEYLLLANKAAIVFLIGFLAWVAIRLFNIFEQFALRRCALKIKDLLHYRKIHTQITVLKKISVALVIFLALVSMLMVSDKVRELGTTLLASAGIIAAIATFAAQKTLTGVVGGVQIALTQPIHLNDMVLIENEMGTIEEITLSYVVIKLQDARRLIVPVNYFIEKPFLNLSRDLKDVQGKVHLFVNYSVSIEALREALKEILQASEKWDRKTASLNVVEAKPNQMELQFLMSANDQIELWQLRCEVREKLIAYIKTHFPDALG